MEEVATMPSNAQEFCLRWNNFHSSLVSALDGFKNDLDFVDVTLACEGQFLKAHKMLLSACSVFFRDLLKANPCQHPIVILPPEVRFMDLEKMLRFIYQGEVNVHQENLARFLKTAEMLKIRGLAEDNEKASSPRPPEGSGNDRGGDMNSSSVSPKRPRLSIDAHPGSEHPPHTPNDENSRLSGPDSDSEMIPVKQEMIELKECDFESADGESFLSESYLRDASSAAASNNNNNNNNNNNTNSTGPSMTQPPPQTHPAAPPPPGPLLPSYVPPPQVKAQDDSPLTSNQDDASQVSENVKKLTAEVMKLRAEIGDLPRKIIFEIRSYNEFQISQATNLTIAEGIPPIPVNDIEQLKEFNDVLQNDEVMTEMIYTLGREGGKTDYDVVRKICCKIFTTEIARQLNWVGAMGKTSLKSLTYLLDLITRAVRNNQKYKDLDVETIRRGIRKWVKYSVDRDGGRKEREKKSNVDNKFNS